MTVQNWTFGLALLGALTCNCTFYTSCPDPNSIRKPPSGGGAGSTGGTNGGGGTSPLPILAKWQNVTNNLAGMNSSCGNLSVVAAKTDNVVLAGVNLHGLWATTDGGNSWHELGQGAGSDPITAGVRAITFDPDNPNTYWLACLYGERGVWRTEDNGETFKILGTIRHNDMVSVDFTDPERKVLLAGGHEIQDVVWRSTDSGATWDNIGVNLPNDSRASSFPLVLGPELHLLGASGYSDGVPGVFRTDDGGANWARVSEIGGYGKPLVLKDGTILWASDDGGLARSTDQGANWEEILPKDSTAGYQSVAQLPDGSFAVLTRYEGIKVTKDNFATLMQITERTPFDTAGFAYSEPNRAFFIWHSDCGEVVLDDAVGRADYDYEAE